MYFRFKCIHFGYFFPLVFLLHYTAYVSGCSVSYYGTGSVGKGGYRIWSLIICIYLYNLLQQDSRTGRTGTGLSLSPWAFSLFLCLLVWSVHSSYLPNCLCSEFKLIIIRCENNSFTETTWPTPTIVQGRIPNTWHVITHWIWSYASMIELWMI